MHLGEERGGALKGDRSKKGYSKYEYPFLLICYSATIFPCITP